MSSFHLFFVATAHMLVFNCQLFSSSLMLALVSNRVGLEKADHLKKIQYVLL